MITLVPSLSSAGARRSRAVRALLLAVLTTAPLNSCTQDVSGAGEAPPLPAGDRFVAPTGDDAATGSARQPWRSLQTAIDRLEPGQVLVVEDGTWPGPLTLTARGSAADPITIRARNTGSVIIDGQGARDAITDADAGLAHVRLQGLRVANADRGFHLTGDVVGLTVEDCAIDHCDHAFLCDAGSDLTLERVLVTDCPDGIGLGVKGRSGIAGVRLIDCSVVYDSDEEADRNTDGFRVEGLCTDVHISGCEGAGFDDSGFDIKPDGALVERCIAHHNWDNGFKLWGDGARLVNCIARDNDDTGVTFAGAAEMYHCTVAFNRRSSFRPGGDDITRIRVRNSILVGLIRVYTTRSGAGVFGGDHNLFYIEPGEFLWKSMDDEERRYLQEEVAGGVIDLGANTIVAPPRFVDADGRDLRPAPDSPAVNAGAQLDFVKADYTGAPRDARPDIGACEAR